MPTETSAASTSLTDRDAIVLQLDKPIEFVGQDTLKELVVRPYTGFDLLKAGMPFATKFDKQGGATIVVDLPSIRLLLAEMAQVPATMIDKLSAYDLNLAIEALKSFFYVPTRAMSSTPTSPPENGRTT